MIDYKFIQGEERTFDYTIWNSDDRPIVVTSSSWEMRNSSDEIVASGECTVNEDCVSLRIPMSSTGDFEITIIASVPPDIIKERFCIRVVA